METIKIKVTGKSPMLMHSDRFSNPLDPMTKEHKILTGKRKKTDEDHEAIAYSEWKGGLYMDDELGPFVPAQNFEACIFEAAKLQKLGKKFKQAVMVVEDKLKLEYSGPRTYEGMFAKPEFVDMRSVKVQAARLQRCRPKFDKWGFECTIAYNPAVVEERDILKAIEDAGMLIGLGDFRPRFGKFESVVG